MCRIWEDYKWCVDDCRAFGGVGDEVVYGVLYCKKLRIGGGV